MLAAIPYDTFPTVIELGPFPIRTFGLMVGLAIVSGAWVAANHAERFGVSRDDIYNLALRMVAAGVVGARLTWVVTHWDAIDSPIDIIAVWEGGLQFSGGFIFGVIIGLPTIMKWDRLTRWRVLDGAAMGLAIGVFFGRIGCVAVGEHFGGVTDFPLAVRWEGGAVPDVREPMLGLGSDAVPVTQGLVFHNTALYEMISVLILFVVLRLMYRRGVGVGTIGGVFLVAYAPLRFLFDALRVNDERVAGLTGAQWMTLAIVPIALWIMIKVRPAVRELELAAADGTPATDAAGGPAPDPDEAEPAATDADPTVTRAATRTDAVSDPTDADVSDADDPHPTDAGLGARDTEADADIDTEADADIDTEADADIDTEADVDTGTRANANIDADASAAGADPDR